MTSQSWDPVTYERNARFVSDLGRDVVALLDPRPGERILDLGCGDGALTVALVEAGCAVVAVDASEAQVAGARSRGLDARVAQAEALPFAAEFDAVFSNAVLHWVRDADAAIASVHRALRAGGRFVGEMGGAGNTRTVLRALSDALARRGVDAASRDPWYFPTEDEYASRLAAGGFDVVSIERFPRPTPLPGPLGDWLRTFAQPLLAGVDDLEALISEVEGATSDELVVDGAWVVDYVRLRFHARLPVRHDRGPDPRP